MPNDTSVMAIKACCACGADVAGQPRMKDSQGKYWCVPCGQADQRTKQITATHANCSGCHKSFAKGKLDKLGEGFYCKACLKKRTQPGSRVTAAKASSGGETKFAAPSFRGSAAAAAQGPASDKRRVVIMSALLAALLLVALLLNFGILG